MSFPLVPKSATLNDVMAVILRYFTEFGKPAFQHITASICGGIYARVYCILYYVYDVVVKKVHVRSLISWWVSCLLYYKRPINVWLCTRGVVRNVLGGSACVVEDVIVDPDTVPAHVSSRLMWSSIKVTVERWTGLKSSPEIPDTSYKCSNADADYSSICFNTD